MINILFFASLKEAIGQDSYSIEMPQASITVKELKQLLCQQQPTWQTALSNPLLLTAINHDMATDEQLIKDNDEVAFFPPVTGG